MLSSGNDVKLKENLINIKKPKSQTVLGFFQN